MIQQQTIVDVSDNTGGRLAKCIKVLGGSSPRGRFKRRTATLGDKLVVAIRKSTPGGDVKQGDISKAVVVRCHALCRRDDGGYIRFDSNAVVLLGNENEPKGTRIFGAVARELRAKGYTKIVSMATEVV